MKVAGVRRPDDALRAPAAIVSFAMAETLNVTKASSHTDPKSSAQDASMPVHNEHGVIAEHYHALQSLGSIEAARAAMPVEPCTNEALLVGLYQSAEIALYNLSDLLDRTSAHLEDRDVNRCVTNLSWVRGFHRVLIRLSLAALRVSAELRTATQRWPVDTTPAFGEFLPALMRFDSALRRVSASGDIDVSAVIAECSFEDPWFGVLHCARIANHDARVWSANFSVTLHPVPEVPIESVLASTDLRRAVHEHHLCGFTFFTQFRGLHQIPELLAREVNDRIEVAVLRMRRGELAEAVEALDGGAELIDPMEACLPPMVDSLSTHDYHQIRENLGLTSGSHSVSLRFHLFTELYDQLVDAIAEVKEGDRQAGLLRRLERHAVRLNTFITAWRDMHLHLPRNNLGGAETKSLTGSPDAIRTVRKMRDNAANADPLSRLNLAVSCPTTSDGPLAAYLDGPESTDGLLLAATGAATQANLHDVQERLGFFAQRCPFSRPPRRVV